MAQNSTPDNVIYPANVSRLRKALKHIKMGLFSHRLAVPSCSYSRSKCLEVLDSTPFLSATVLPHIPCFCQLTGRQPPWTAAL